MKISQIIATENGCYKAGKRIVPTGIVVHSTGANNPYIKRYVGPDDGIIGTNIYNNHWNKASATKCMHAFIGKTASDEVACYQTLPWDYRCWGCGSGKNGSYNASHIQFEICEDNLKNADYYAAAFGLAIDLCVYLCKQFNISVNNIVGHYEAADAGYASNHADPRNWQKLYNDSMDQFRQQVAAGLNGEVPVEEPPSDIYVTLRKGASGAYVTEMQTLLIAAGYTLPVHGVDASFGDETLSALMEFQKEHGLAVDGVCGAATWAALRVPSNRTRLIIPGQVVSVATGKATMLLLPEDIEALKAMLAGL